MQSERETQAYTLAHIPHFLFGPAAHVCEGVGGALDRKDKRKFFEDTIRKNRKNVTTWLKYAKWEESQREVDRYVRPPPPPSSPYARRAPGSLPRPPVLTRRGVPMFAGGGGGGGARRRARSVYERALDEDYRAPQIYIQYAEMEMRLRNVNHARNVWDRAVAILPRVDTLWYRYALMEETLGNIAGTRQVFERWMGTHRPPTHPHPARTEWHSVQG
jgi:crooked neck